MKLVRTLILVILSILSANAEEVTLYTKEDAPLGAKVNSRGTFIQN